MSEKIIAYKGMDENMRCRGKQYEVGKTYTEDKADCCHAGMHACVNPFDVFSYYQLNGKNRFFEVECSGDVSKGDCDSKLACTELTIKGEMNFAGLVKATVQAVFDRVKEKGSFFSGDYSTAGTSGYSSTAGTSGDYSTAGTSGYSSTAGTSGDSSTAAATGSFCKAESTGANSIAVANGYESKARGAMGDYLVLTEYDSNLNLVRAKMAQVDGDQIKPHVWYILKNGEFVEA